MGCRDSPCTAAPHGSDTPHLGLTFPVPPGPATTCKPLPEPPGSWDHPEPRMLSEPIAGTRAPHAEVPRGLTCWQVFLVKVSGSGCVPLSSPEIGSGTWRGSRWSSRSCCAGQGWATGSSSAPRRAGNAWPTTPSCCWADPGGASPSPCEGRPQHLLALHPPWPGRVSLQEPGTPRSHGGAAGALHDPNFWLGCIPDYKAWDAHPLWILHPVGCCNPTQPSRCCPSCWGNPLQG